MRAYVSVVGVQPTEPWGAAVWGASCRGRGRWRAAPGRGGWRLLPARGLGKHPPEARLGGAPAARAGARGEEVSAFRPPARLPSGESLPTPAAGRPGRRERRVRPAGSLGGLGESGKNPAVYGGQGFRGDFCLHHTRAAQNKEHQGCDCMDGWAESSWENFQREAGSWEVVRPRKERGD